MAAFKRDIVRFTKASLQRNQNLIIALQEMEREGPMCPSDIGALFSFRSASAGRSMMRELQNNDLVEFSHFDGESEKSKGTAMFKIKDGALDLAKQLYPITDLQAKTNAANPPSVTVKSVMFSHKPTNVNVRRDPLHVFLMGHGRAPSLNFRDYQGEQSC